MTLLLPRDSTQWNISGTSTFRLSSRMLTLAITKTKRDGQCGGNLQNKEGSMREMYWTDNKLSLQRDQAGAEALIVAYLTRHGRFRDLFIYGIKPHVYVGLLVFKEVWKKEVRSMGIDSRPDIDAMCNAKISELPTMPGWKDVDRLIRDSDNWPSERRYYYVAKQICHSSNYDVKAGMFQLNTLEKSKGKIVLERRDCEMYLDIYHNQLFPEIHEWHRDVERQVSETNMLFNLFGYPRFFWFTDKIDLKECYAFIPQSTVGCITHLAITDTQRYIEEHDKDWDILQNNHDSMWMQFPDNDLEEARIVTKQNMERELVSPRGEKFNMRSECSIGRNWGKRKKNKDGSYHNPEGMHEIKE